MSDRELLSAYADGEVNAAERAQIETLLSTDAAAAAHLTSIRQTKTFTAQFAKPIENEELWQTCCGRLTAIDKTKKIEGFVGKYSWALCAVFFLVIVAGGMLRHFGANSLRTGQVASYVSALGGSWSHAPAQPEMRRQWTEQQFQAIQNAVQPDRLVLTDTQQGFVDGHRLFCYRLADSQGLMDLVVVSNASAAEDGAPVDGVRGGNVNNASYVTWNQGDYAIFLLADASQRSPEELATVSETLRAR